MSLLQGMQTAVQGSSNVASIASSVRDNRNPRRSAFEHAVELSHSRICGVWRIVGLWHRRSKDRAMLRSLSPRDIQDFCPRHTEAEAEMNKPFWQA